MMLSLLTNMPREVLVQQIYDGLVLLVLGMGTVFVFLVILIYSTKIMSKICMKFEAPEPAPSAKKPSASTAAPKAAVTTQKANDAAIAAAIAAAYDKDR